MRRVTAVVLVVLVSFAWAEEATPEGEKKEKQDLVLELTNDNFDTSLKEHNHVIIFFYNSDCHRCKEELQEYLSAAKVLRDSAGSRVRFALVHGGKSKELVDRLDIKRYPSIRLVNKGDFENAAEYKYIGQKDMTVLNWLVKFAMPVRQIDDRDELQKFITKRSVPVGFFRDASSPEAKAFHHVAKDDTDTFYGVVTNAAVLDEVKLEGSARIVFYKSDGSKETYDGPWDSKSIRIFVDSSALPTVVKLSQNVVSLLHRTALKRDVVLFASKKSAEFSALFAEFEAVAKKYRGKFVFIFDDLDTETDEDRLRDLFGIQPKDGAQIRILFSGDKATQKFRPATQEALSADSIGRFVEDVLQSRLAAYTLSQALPKDWNASPVKVLVASNYQKETADRSRATLVLFTSPWCSSCVQLEKLLREFAESLKDRKDVLVAHVDRTQNDIEGLHFRHGFPSLRLIPKDAGEAIEYFGDRNVDALKVFVDSNGKEVVRGKRRAKDEL